MSENDTHNNALVECVRLLELAFVPLRLFYEAWDPSNFCEI